MASPEVNHLPPLSVSLILSIMENDSTLTKIVIFRKNNPEKKQKIADLSFCFESQVVVAVVGFCGIREEMRKWRI